MSQFPQVELDEIFEIARGGSPRPIDSFITDDPNGVNWIMIGDAKEGSKYITSTKKRIIRDGVKKSRRVSPGDFLLTNSMSFGKPYILKTSGCIHDGWLVLSPRTDRIDHDYIYHLLGSDLLYNEFEKRAAGAVVKNLNSNLVRSVKIPLPHKNGKPDLDEQKRIAAILDKADAIRRKRQQALRLTDDFLRSVFLDMFGDPVTNPMGWDVEELKNLGKVSTGTTPPSKNEGMFDGDIPFVTPGDLMEGPVVTRRSVTEEGAKNSRVVRAGATFVCCIGATIGKMGKAAARSSFNQQINAVEWDDRVTDDYGLEVLKFFKSTIATRGSSTTLPILNKSAFQSLEIPVPPRELQDKFSATLATLQRFRGRQEEVRSSGADLFAALQQRAFRGEL